jgi:hypothetical protein
MKKVLTMKQPFTTIRAIRPRSIRRQANDLQPVSRAQQRRLHQHRRHVNRLHAGWSRRIEQRFE